VKPGRPPSARFRLERLTRTINRCKKTAQAKEGKAGIGGATPKKTEHEIPPKEERAGMLLSNVFVPNKRGKNP